MSRIDDPASEDPAVRIVDISGADVSCEYDFDDAVPPTGTARAEGLCDPTGAGGFALVLDGAPGTVVGEQGDDVYVAAVAPSNPFPAGSRDAVNFNAMRLTPADVSPPQQPDGRPSVTVAREKRDAALAGGVRDVVIANLRAMQIPPPSAAPGNAALAT